ncbi:queuosine precursor transporter [Candidatus Parvarchaeota archaeon]|nr:queuosine precursor transporter [Candidatus Parvarchaeota archaeon]
MEFLPKFTKRQKLDLCYAFFVTCLIAANTIGLKVTDLGGPTISFTLFGLALKFGLIFSVAILTYPLTFVIIDAVGVVYGKKEAKNIINIGLVAIVIMAIFTFISLTAPAAARFAYEKEYQALYAISGRIMIASLVAYWISHVVDINVFHDLWEKYKGKKIWLVTTISNVVGEFVDTIIFMLLAFYGVAGFPLEFIISISVPWWLYKVFANMLHTPLVYWAIGWLKKDD